MSTEEDGVDKAGRTTQSPPIMAPSDPEADPVEEAADTTGKAPETVPLPAETVGSANTVGPADTIGKADAVGKPKAGTTRPVKADAADKDANGSAADPGDAKTGTNGNRAPSFTPTQTTRPSATPATPAAPNAPATPATPATSAGPAAYSGTATQVPPQNGSAATSFASGTAAAVTGAASGLAGSVASAWNNRGQSGKQQPQVRPPRKSSKRQAMLTLARVEPWSVMKFSFVASVVAFVILFVAVALLYLLLAALGVFDSLQHTVSSITSSQGTSGTNISHWTSPSLILGYTAMLGALNIVLITAISTIGSVIYNLIAKTAGGIEVTLRETD